MNTTKKTLTPRAILPRLWQLNKTLFATENLVPGSSVYGEKIISIDGKECRAWSATDSKLAAALSKGLVLPLDSDSVVLYLGSSTGSSLSHISDIVKEGFVFGIDIAPRVVRELVFLSQVRQNIAPILASAGHPELYEHRLCLVDWVYQDIAAPNQVSIFVQNCIRFLERGKTAALCLKAQSISMTKKPAQLYAEATQELQRHMKVVQTIPLDPLYKDHCVFVCKKS